MNHELEKTIVSLKEIKNIFANFSTKEEAIKFLMKETKLSKEECTIAYDFFIKMNLEDNNKLESIKEL